RTGRCGWITSFLRSTLLGLEFVSEVGSSHVDHWLVGEYGRDRPRAPHLPSGWSRSRHHRPPSSLDVSYSVLRESHVADASRARRAISREVRAPVVCRVPGVSPSYFDVLPRRSVP